MGNPTKTCGWCKRTFELLEYDQIAISDEDPRFLCEKCAIEHGVPDGWIQCSTKEREVTEDAKGTN